MTVRISVCTDDGRLLNAAASAHGAENSSTPPDTPAKNHSEIITFTIALLEVLTRTASAAASRVRGRQEHDKRHAALISHAPDAQTKLEFGFGDVGDDDVGRA